MRLSFGESMEDRKIDDLMRFLEKKYPNRSSGELFDLLEVVIGCSDIIENAGDNWDLVEEEILKRYGSSEDISRSETDVGQEDGGEREFHMLAMEIVRQAVETINSRAALIESGIKGKRRHVLRLVIEKLQELDR